MLYRDKVNVQIRNPLATVLWHDIERMYAMRPSLSGRVGDSMVKLYEDGIYLRGGSEVVPAAEAAERGITQAPDDAKRGTIAYSILQAHNTSGDPEALKIRFDAMASHDITFVGIIQTARASGMEQFPLPYVLTNCHNSLCAVGGTINEDDHVFGLSAAKKYGGIFVPPHIAVIHSFMRENFAGCGKMILGSDSHTRYGALGTMAVGEGGGELAKQLLRDTYDVAYPGVVAIYLTGAPRPGVGPHDVALAIIRAVFARGYVKNKVMEFVGPGIASMTTDYRNGVDVMTTETTCLSSIWATDEDTHAFLTMHGRGDDYRELKPADVAYYDGCVEVDLSSIKPMIALPFHPSNGFEIDELNENLEDILHEVELDAAKIGEGKTHFSLLDKIVDGKLHVQQGVIAGCSGGNYDSVVQAARVLKGANTGCGEFSLSVYPTSQPVALELTRRGYIYDLMEAGAIVRTAFCGPCFGAGDTPANNGLSIRHTTRNFPNREGSKPGNGQLSAVALMDARSIAATAANGGVLTPATDLPEETWDEACEYTFDDAPYKKRVYWGFGKAEPADELSKAPTSSRGPRWSPLATISCSRCAPRSWTRSPRLTSSFPRARRAPSAPTRWAWPSLRSAAAIRPTWVAPRRSMRWKSAALPARQQATWRHSMPSLPACLRRWPARVSRQTPRRPSTAPCSMPRNPVTVPPASRPRAASA